MPGYNAPQVQPRVSNLPKGAHAWTIIHYMVPRGNGSGGGGGGGGKRYSSSELSSEPAEKRANKAAVAASLAGISHT